MKKETINLLESVRQNSIANAVDKVAEQFKSEIIKEYKASETKEMSTKLENKITKALALEGVDSPENWVADVCSVALDMTPTGEALAIKEDENTKGQLKQSGIKSIDDIINDLVHKEDTFRYQMLSRLQMDCDYFLGNGNRADKHLWAGNVPDHIKIMRALYNSFSDDKKPEWISMEDIDNYEKEMTNAPAESEEKAQLTESAALDKIGNAIPEGYKEYMLSNDFTAKTFNSKEKLLKDLKSYNITSFKDVVNNTLTINCKDMYGHRFKTIITWKHLDNKVQESEKKEIEDREKRPLTESVDWSYFDKFNDITSKYMPDRGEGETLASQIVTAINKLIYKWYNDGDVYDNVNSGMRGWANDLSSYANWLDKYCKPASKILDSIYNCNNDSEYENILKALADKCLTEEYLSTMEQPKQGSIYDCDGQYEFKEQYDDDEEEY